MLFVAVMFFGCSSSSDSGSSDQTITFDFNGQNLTAVVKSARLFKSEPTDEKLLEIIAETDDKQFEISFYSGYTADNGMALGNYLTTDTSDDGYVYVSYKINGNTYGVHSPDAGTLTINACNSSSKKFSGTFNETLHAIGETDDFEFQGVQIPYEINITNGVFTNINYEVVNIN